MRDTGNGSDSGQSLVEYVLILAGIAVVCVVTIIILSGAINTSFGSTSNSFNPPAAPSPRGPPLQWPTSVAQCMNGGWRNYPQFADEASCVQSVTGGG